MGCTSAASDTSSPRHAEPASWKPPRPAEPPPPDDASRWDPWLEPPSVAGAIQKISPRTSSAMNRRPSGAKLASAGRPCAFVPSSQPTAKLVSRLELALSLAIGEGRGLPVAGSVAMATILAPAQDPKAPCRVRITLPAHRPGQVSGAKSKPNGVSPMTKELPSGATRLQSGVGATSG